MNMTMKTKNTSEFLPLGIPGTKDTCCICGNENAELGQEAFKASWNGRPIYLEAIQVTHCDECEEGTLTAAELQKIDEACHAADAQGSK